MPSYIMLCVVYTVCLFVRRLIILVEKRVNAAPNPVAQPKNIQLHRQKANAPYNEVKRFMGGS